MSKADMNSYFVAAPNFPSWTSLWTFVFQNQVDTSQEAAHHCQQFTIRVNLPLQSAFLQFTVFTNAVSLQQAGAIASDLRHDCVHCSCQTWIAEKIRLSDLVGLGHHESLPGETFAKSGFWTRRSSPYIALHRGSWFTIMPFFVDNHSYDYLHDHLLFLQNTHNAAVW